MKIPSLDMASKLSSLGTNQAKRIFLLSLSVAVGAYLRFHILGVGSLWQADCFSIAVARMPWPTFLRTMWWGEGNMAFYYLLLRGWIQFGDSEVWLESLSAIFGILAIPTVYAFGKRFLNVKTGLFAAALLAVHPYYISHSGALRAYGLWPVLVILSSYSFLAIVASPDRKAWWMLYVFFSLLAIYTQVFTVFLICAQWLALRPNFIAKLGTSKIFAAAITMGILSLPMVRMIAFENHGQLNWVPRLSIGGFWLALQALTGTAFLDSQRLIAIIAVVLTGLFFVTWILAVWGFTDTRGVDENAKTSITLSALIWWLIFPLAVMTLISFWKPILWPRFLLVSVPAAVLLAGQGLVTMERRIPSWRWGSILYFLIMCCLGLFASLISSASFRSAGGADWRIVTKYILDRQEPGDAVIFYSPSGKWVYDYYVQRERGSSGLSSAPPVLSELTLDRPDLERRTKEYRRVWLVINQSSPTPRSRADIGLLMQTLQQRFSLKEKRIFGGSAANPDEAVRLFLYEVGRPFAPN